MKTLATARAIILNPDRRMLILQRSSSDPLAPGTWDLPGGRWKPGEALEEAAVRETEEETGILLHDPVLFFATSALRSDKSKTWLFFLGQLDKQPPVSLSADHSGYQWIEPLTLNDYTDYDILLALHAHMIESRYFAQRA